MVSCEKISDDANAELKSTLAGFFESVKKVKRTEDNFRDVMKGTVIDVKETMGSFRSEMGDVKNLEAEMADAFSDRRAFQGGKTMMPWNQTSCRDSRMKRSKGRKY